MRKLHSFTYNPNERKAKAEEGYPLKEEEEENGGAVFLPGKMKDYSDFEPTCEEAAVFSMLLLQSLVIESLINTK
jgi:hypothetical protein